MGYLSMKSGFLKKYMGRSLNTVETRGERREVERFWTSERSRKIKLRMGIKRSHMATREDSCQFCGVNILIKLIANLLWVFSF